MATPRCTCGYTVFYDRVLKSTALLPRWRRVHGYGGFGITPFGMNFGDFGLRAWGKFFIEVTSGLLATTCKSCHRVRRATPIGGGTAMGAWQSGDSVFVLLTDAADPGCMLGRFELDDGQVVETPARRVYLEAPYFVGHPIEQQEQLPVDAVVAETVYRFTLPDGVESGGFHFLLRDRCLDTLQSIEALNA
jgi:hypothetical protein